jgi:hypothetical protein
VNHALFVHLSFLNLGPASAWVVLFLLGAYHGINPGMGWLFAVALGMQKQSDRAVWQSLLPIAAGHVLAIGLVVAVAATVGAIIPASSMRIAVACLLLAFGLFRLLRRGHPRWGGMQVGFADLTIWSFLMASAHGAGLMLLPLVMRMSGGDGHHHGYTTGMAAIPPGTSALAVGLHSLGYLLVTGTVAFAVYKKLGVSFLRKAWINLDLIWAVALIVTAGLALL